jgi:flagellar export protein FliJ
MELQMAKMNRFRLSTVLKLRQQREDEHRRIVATRLREIMRTQEHIMALNEQIDKEIDAMRGGRRGGMLDVTEIARHRHWVTHLQRGILENEAQLRGLLAKLSQERAELVSFSRDRKVLDILKKRHMANLRHKNENRRRLEEDEIGLRSFLLQMSKA